MKFSYKNRTLNLANKWNVNDQKTGTKWCDIQKVTWGHKPSLKNESEEPS